MRSAIRGGVGILGAGLQPGGTLLLVHVQHPQRHTGQWLFDSGHSAKLKDLKQVVIGLYCDVLLFIVNRKTHRITFYIQKELCTKANLFHKGSLLKTLNV